jgi:hypothetical protein
MKKLQLRCAGWQGILCHHYPSPEFTTVLRGNRTYTEASPKHTVAAAVLTNILFSQPKKGVTETVVG